FTDVPADAYYAKAVLWAVEQGITTGKSKTKFGVGSPCTREQVVTFLWRAEGKPQPENTTNPFTDVSETAYSYTAILWAVEKGITKGTSKTKFSPAKTCTRGQVVTFLYRDVVGEQ
nr:S-layer homology domain-containing protein [Oscillospiraceae bacterium]